MKKLFVPFTLVLLLIFSGRPAARERRASRKEILKKEKKLEDVKKQIGEEKKNIKAISEKESSILGEIENINKNLVEKREELTKTEASLGALRKDVSATNNRINGLDKERKALSERLKLRMRAMYKMGRGEAIKVLFSTESSKDLGRKHKYLTMIMDSDSRLIDDYEKNLLRLKSEKMKIDALLRETETTRNLAVARKNEAEAVEREKTALLTGIKHEKGRRARTIKELEQAALDLTELLNKLRPQEEIEAPNEAPAGSGFAFMKGRLKMPVEGNVVSFYGRVKNPRFQTVTFNNGVIIEAPVGAPVKSVYDGRVIYLGWLKGYGQVLIIDNGGGFYTLFAHLSKILKEKGDVVKKGDEVGYVGDTGPTNSSGLYFEIRQRGVPRDPLPWFAKK